MDSPRLPFKSAVGTTRKYACGSPDIVRQRVGNRSTGKKSIEFIRKTQMKTVRASGATNLRDFSLCTIAFA